MYQVISSGSHGNAVLYCNSILVDIGVGFDKIKPYVNKIQLVLLTHEHLSDHLNISTLKRLIFERPSVRIGCGVHMLPFLKGFRNIDIYDAGGNYNYGLFAISPVKLYHDVTNFGYRIFYGNYKIFHATDTAHLDGISAKNYDLYAIEHNYNEDAIFDRMERKQSNGEFSYEKRSINSHLSEQAARDFIFKNMGEHSQVLRLHESKTI